MTIHTRKIFATVLAAAVTITTVPYVSVIANAETETDETTEADDIQEKNADETDEVNADDIDDVNADDIELSSDEDYLSRSGDMPVEQHTETPRIVEKESDQGLQSKKVRLRASTTPVQTEYSKYSSDYVYRQLPNESEKDFYNALTEAAARVMDSSENLETFSVDFYGVKEDNVFKTIERWRETEAQYFFVASHCEMKEGTYVYVDYPSRTTKGTLLVSVKKPYQNGAARQSAKQAFFNNISDIISKADKETSIIVKEKAVHDEYCSRVTYDNTAVNNGTSGNDQDAASAILDGLTVCGGYAAGYSVLMNAMGIPAISEVSTTYTDPETGKTSSHEYNKINLGGTWYLVDSTWDDNSKDENKFNYIDFCPCSYRFFNVSDATARTGTGATTAFHSPSDTWAYINPSCPVDSLSVPQLNVRGIGLNYKQELDVSQIEGRGTTATSNGVAVPGTFTFKDEEKYKELKDPANYNIVIVFTPDDPNYLTVSSNFFLKIYPPDSNRDITVKVNDKTINTGDSIPDFDGSLVSGSLYDGDSLGTLLTYSTDATDTNSPGTYTITAVASSAAKYYNITIQNGTLTIRKSAINNGYVNKSLAETMRDDLNTSEANPGIMVNSQAYGGSTLCDLKTYTNQYGVSASVYSYTGDDGDKKYIARCVINVPVYDNGDVDVAINEQVRDVIEKILDYQDIEYNLIVKVNLTNRNKSFEIYVDSSAIGTYGEVYNVDNSNEYIEMYTDEIWDILSGESMTLNSDFIGFELRGGDEAAATDRYIMSEVKAKPSRVTIKRGKTKKLSVSPTNSVKDVTWSSSKKSVAKVNRNTGKVQGIKKGKATIKAKVTFWNGDTKTIKITVKVK